MGGELFSQGFFEMFILCLFYFYRISPVLYYLKSLELKFGLSSEFSEFFSFWQNIC